MNYKWVITEFYTQSLNIYSSNQNLNCFQIPLNFLSFSDTIFLTLSETNSNNKWKKLETRFGTFEFVILKLFRVSDFVLWILCWFRLVAWTETPRLLLSGARTIEPAKRREKKRLGFSRSPFTQGQVSYVSWAKWNSLNVKFIV